MTYAVDATPPFYHGTRADLRVGDLLSVGWASNYGSGAAMSWIYFSASVESAVWGAELAAGDGRERIYIVEPTGDFVDDPNLTDAKFRGNPTASYRSRAPLKIVGELTEWTPHPPEQVQAMRDHVSALTAQGITAID